MRFLFTLILSLTIAFCGFSQEVSQEWGNLSQVDFDYQPEFDPDSEAVVLYDFGSSKFALMETGFEIRFERRKRISILKESGTKYAEVAIPYYVEKRGSSERIIDIEAVAYNLENGVIKKTKLDPTTIFQEQIAESWKVQKFAIPNAKAGTIIEYRYVLESPFLFKLPDWEFQSKIPTVFSQYQVALVPIYEYQFIAQGITRFDFQESKEDRPERTYGSIKFHDMLHTYQMKNISGFKDESYITTIDDYIMKLDFQLSKISNSRGAETEILTTWPKLTEALLKHEKFGRHIKQLKKKSDDQLAEILSTSGIENKTEAIIDHVRKNYNWNGNSSKYATMTVKKFLETKEGSSADLNLYLVALLQNAGVDASPVILSTRPHGKINSDYPFSHMFNEVVVLVRTDKYSFLADATESFMAWSQIPARCMNGSGLVVDESGKNWVALTTPKLSNESQYIEMTLDTENEMANVDVVIRATDMDAYFYRKHLLSNETNAEKVLEANGLAAVKDIKIQNMDNPNKSFSINAKGEIEYEMIANKIVLKPLAEFPMQKNSMTAEKRSYPIDLIYPHLTTYTSVVNIPENYEVTSLPKAYDISNSLYEISYVTNQVDGQIRTTGSVAFKQGVYPPDEYKNLKFAMNQIVKYFNQEVVLTVKTTE